MIKNLLICEAGITTFAHALTVIGFRGKPKNPPSVISKIKRENYLEGLKHLSRHKQYILLWFAYGLIIGVFHGASNTMSLVIYTYGFGSSDTSYATVALMTAGIAGSILCGLLLKKYKFFKWTLMVLSAATMVALVGLMFILRFESLALLILFMSFIGLFILPMAPTFYEYACELIFPIGEGSAVGFLMSSASIFGILYTILFSLIMDSKKRENTVAVLVVVITQISLGTVLVRLTTESLKRIEAERQMKEKLQNHKQASDPPEPHKAIEL